MPPGDLHLATLWADSWIRLVRNGAVPPTDPDFRSDLLCLVLSAELLHSNRGGVRDALLRVIDQDQQFMTMPVLVAANAPPQRRYGPGAPATRERGTVAGPEVPRHRRTIRKLRSDDFVGQQSSDCDCSCEPLVVYPTC